MTVYEFKERAALIKRNIDEIIALAEGELFTGEREIDDSIVQALNEIIGMAYALKRGIEVYGLREE